MNRRTLLRSAPLALAAGITTAPAPRPARADGMIPLRVAALGQSNAAGMAPPWIRTSWYERGDRFAPDAIPTCFYPDGTRGVLCDPTHGGTHLYPVTNTAPSQPYGGGYWPLVARELLLAGVLLEVVACAKAGSSAGAWRFPVGSTETTCLRGATLALCAQAGPIDLAYWHQGETNAANGTTAAQYRNAVEAVGAWVWSDLGCPLMLTLLQHCDDKLYPGQNTINSVLADLAGVPPFLPGADLRSINTQPADGVHLVTDAQIRAAAGRVAAAILAWKFAPV